MSAEAKLPAWHVCMHACMHATSPAAGSQTLPLGCLPAAPQPALPGTVPPARRHQGMVRPQRRMHARLLADRQVLDGADGAKAADGQWPAFHRSMVHASPLMVDLDGDGVLDILVATYDGEVLAVKDTVCRGRLCAAPLRPHASHPLPGGGIP